MDIFDKMADFAKSLRESPEYVAYQEIKMQIEMKTEASELLREYRARQFALELAEISGEGIDEVSDALADICAKMEQDALLNRYLDAEFELHCLLVKIQNIFTENMGMASSEVFTLDGHGEKGRSGFLN